LNTTSALWVLVAFFGASVVFNGLRRLTDGESTAVVVGVQLAALALVVGIVVVLVRRLR
jgi:hypothetical protein